MTGSVHTHSGQAQEPQCYNCGSQGHWAVACPEPTRETPAGLAAWRSASAAGQGNAKSQGYASGSKRPRGPIITKYTPPPFAPAMGPYPPPPPPPPGAQPPPGLYPAQSYPPPFPAGYPQPAFSYSHQFVPPPPYGLPHYDQPAHMGLPAPLPPPGSLPSGSPNPLEFRPSLPPYHAPFSHPAPSHKPVSAKGSPGGLKHERAELLSPKPTTAPPMPPGARLSHPLPPKPPPSHDQMKPQRDHRNRRKNERQNHQEKGHRGYRAYKSNGPQTPNSSAHHDVYSPPSSIDRYLPANSPSRGRRDQVDAAFGISAGTRRTSRSPEKRADQSEAQDARATIVDETKTNPDADAIDGRNEILPADEEDSTSRPVDGTGQSIVNGGQGRLPSPRSTDVSGSVLDFAGVNGEAIGPMEASDGQEDGEISSNEDVLSPVPDDRAVADGKRKSPAAEECWKRKRRHSDEWDDDEEFVAKRSRPNGSSHVHDRVSKDGGVGDDPWSSLNVPRQADRKRRGSTASRGSRHSTVSSKSSDLNSLEAELLGRPVKPRQAEEASTLPRLRPERRAASKPKRRQTNTNSPYGRRW